MTDKITNPTESHSITRVAVETAVMAGIASIPLIGSGIHVTLSSYFEQKKEKRWKDFWNDIIEKLDKVNETKLDTNYFYSEDFFIRMEAIYNEISVSSDRKKITYLRDYIINCAKKSAPGASWIEIYSRHLVRMTGAHLNCLQAICTVQSQLSEMERFHRKSDRAPLHLKAINDLVGSDWDEDLVEIVLADLQSAGLVQIIHDHANAKIIGWGITNIGIKFMGFVTSDEA